MIRERERRTASGLLMLVVFFVVLGVGVLGVIRAASVGDGVGALIFFFAAAYLLGREYFELAAMRFHPPAEAKRLRRLHRSTVFVSGMFIAAFVSIPVVNLATPLFGVAFMVHMHKRLARASAPLLDQPARVNKI
jgi:uncharacterized protein involved in cysteine biosynthesis